MSALKSDFCFCYLQFIVYYTELTLVFGLYFKWKSNYVNSIIKTHQNYVVAILREFLKCSFSKRPCVWIQGRRVRPSVQNVLRTFDATGHYHGSCLSKIYNCNEAQTTLAYWKLMIRLIARVIYVARYGESYSTNQSVISEVSKCWIISLHMRA